MEKNDGFIKIPNKYSINLQETFFRIGTHFLGEYLPRLELQVLESHCFSVCQLSLVKMNFSFLP